ncbi:MAG: hypothetical protein WDO70_06795 [Alphaproteobacteria bacterium]
MGGLRQDIAKLSLGDYLILLGLLSGFTGLTTRLVMETCSDWQAYRDARTPIEALPVKKQIAHVDAKRAMILCRNSITGREGYIDLPRNGPQRETLIKILESPDRAVSCHIRTGTPNRTALFHGL